MRKLLLCLVLAFALLPAISAQSNDPYTKALKEMFVASGSEATYKAVIKQMMGMFKAQYTQVPAEVMNNLEQEFLKTSMDELAEKLVPVYKKHLTIDDVKGLTAFYQTPLGKKYANQSPAIMQESMTVGQQWGMTIGQSFAKKVKEKGY